MASTTPQPSEVGWQFVPQYYQYVNKEPERLHCFYGKASTFVHGTEGEDAHTCHGQTEIHAQITKIGFENCKIFIHSVDAQSSANNGIVIQVIGEMSNKDETEWRKFVQTFFLAEQPNGYFVLNDIFRFLKEESVDDEVAEEEVAEVAAPTPEPIPEPVAAPPVPPAPEHHEPPPPVAADPTAAPVQEPPTTVSDIADAPVETPTPAPEPQPTQMNGIHHETEKPKPSPSPAPVPKSPIPPAAVSAPAAAGTPPPPPYQPPAPSTVPPPATAAPSAAPAPPAAPQPVQPAAPPQPKTWANLAAANSKKWGSAVAQESRGTTENVPSTPSAGSGAHTPQNVPATPVGPRAGTPHPAYVAAQSVNIPQCFIKSVNEAVTEAALKTALSRFGPVKSVEIVRNKACAFAEFQNAEAAKRAIIASLSVNAGGEGGLKVEAEGGTQRVIVETKRERGDRPVNNRGRGGPPFNEGRGASGGDRGSGFRGARGGGTGRGRGNAGK
ncbi:hypothetical protein D9758_011441 [Tetrapyrgos nigripes]|uniref:G3BP-like protein n=1 Tax=Tetrapyrgos nigripes TaxID=182062 RepID=A0A8H5FQY7_9AGAR|nr:hypothetical protein D9758_011441 [Tetrapyrgos nigripes]